MTKVYKFHFPKNGFGVHEIDMPIGSKIISCQLQSVFFTIWAIVHENNIYEKRVFEVVGTGQPFEDSRFERVFIATIQAGVMVFHVFEQVK